MKSLNKAFWGIFLGISFLASIASCKPSVPGEYLSEKEMENVLYDFHIAEAMANAFEYVVKERMVVESII